MDIFEEMIRDQDVAKVSYLSLRWQLLVSFVN